jgi:DNA polymerase-3 subunit epsilon
LLDAEILAEVYLAMTGGQASLSLSSESGSEGASSSVGSPVDIRRLPTNRKTTPIIRADKDELARHEARLSELEKTADSVLWRTVPRSARDL